MNTASTFEPLLTALATEIGRRIAAPVVAYRRWYRKRAVLNLLRSAAEFYGERVLLRTPAQYARFEFLIFGDNLVYPIPNGEAHEHR